MGTWYFSNIYFVTGTIQEKDRIQSMNSFISEWTNVTRCEDVVIFKNFDSIID